MTHSLTLGDALLTGSKHSPDPTHGFWFEVCAEGTEFGEPEAVTRIVTSLMVDGAAVAYDRDGNRTIPIKVRVNGPTLAAVAHGEAMLRRESKRLNELTWQPPDTFAFPSVYETYPSPMSRLSDGDWDLDEKVRRVRTFRLSLTCGPFARSLNPVVIDQLASGSTTTSVDTCDSATGWTGTRNGAPTTAEGPTTLWEAGAVSVMELSDTEGFAPEAWTMTRTGAVDFSTTPYLEVEVTTLDAKGGAQLSVSAHLNGSPEPLPILQVRRLTDGSQYFRVTFDTRGVAATSITFKHTSVAGYGFVWQGFLVRNIARSNVMPNVSSARQVSRIIEVDGTERTTASLRVKSATSADLGHTLVATWPEMSAGFSPSMRQWRASGNTVVADSATISGSREAIGPSAVSFGVPASSIPAGAYQLIARLRSVGATGSLNVFWEAGTSIESVLLDGTISGSHDASFPVLGRWEMVPLGTLVLPVIAANAGDLFMGINHAGSTQVEYDEVWLFPIGEDCAISGADVTATHYWCDAPDHTESNPSFRIGNTDDRSNARSPGMATIAKGVHSMRPGQMVVFVAATVDGPLVDGSLYERWHSNAAS